MDKTEYKNTTEEMKELIAEGKIEDAISIADEINWRKVRNINELLTGSEVYEAAGKLEEARDLLLLAHERSPIGRMILYRLAIISINMKDLEAAQDYCNQFVQVAPHDSLKYIIKYKINLARKADNVTLIKILEQMKEQDFLEEWAFELAYLYHKTGIVDKCIDICDEIILWFGDGPYVERALELKMLYQPLDKMQEDKYRHFQQKKDGITEITANEDLHSGEIVPHTVTIPRVELPPERFNTVNLQAEIKKSIDEIMKATEADEVSENIDAIKTLVEEIPYLQVPDQIQSEAEAETSSQKTSINEVFQEYLAEEYDGQMSLLLPENGNSDQDEQVKGQMTIEDVIAEWEKTRRAAEAALEDVKKQELEAARARALKEAAHVLNRLEEAMPRLDAGVSSTELLKEEYLAGGSERSSVNMDSDAKEVFVIPKIDVDGDTTGSMNIPVIHQTDEMVVLNDTSGEKGEIQYDDSKATDWNPPVLDENQAVDLKEASEIIADVNKMLQDEIDRIMSEEDPASENTQEEIISEVLPEVSTEEESLPIPEVLSEMAEPPCLENDNVAENTVETPCEPSVGEPYNTETNIAEANITETREEIELPEIDMSGIFGDDKVDAPVIQEATVDVSEESWSRPVRKSAHVQLTTEDMETFSYFMPISGMKASITQALSGAIAHLEEDDKRNGGNIIIQGEKGTGKTQLATCIVKVLQRKTGRLEGGIGKIDADKLNQKDLHQLYGKIQGGCLIIERARDISKETALTLSLLMSQDTEGTLIILEDTKKGVDKAILQDASFAKKFTERINIPVFTINELVEFGKTYAAEAGYTLEGMAELALHNRINMIGRLDHATCIREVAEIMEEAMASAGKGGLFGRKKSFVLKEKDFEVK